MTNQFPASILGPLTADAARAIIAEDLLESEPFVWRAEISSDRLDAYYTHMSERTLRNFAADAAAGVTFLDSHDHRQLGYGQSLTGVFEAGAGISRVLADFYTVPGIKFGSGLSYASTDDFIRAVQSRLTRDVSVGFYDGDMICDICGKSFYDWRECPHWPGVEYPVGEQGEQTVTATFEIDDAHLAEVSAVYDGATPEAMIVKARQQAEAGELEPRVARILEVKYRIKPDPRHVWPGVEIKERSIPMTMTEPTLEERLEQAEHQLAEAAAEIERLRPLAQQGERYRAELIEEVLAEGVRANGDGFPIDAYREILAGTSLENILAMREQYAAQARKRFPGGRQTVDTDEPEAAAEQQAQSKPQRANGLPDSAYAA